MKTPLITLVGLAAAGLALSACQEEETEAVGIANPAAVFCIESGGEYEIRKGDEGEYGVCKLADGTEIDAWEYYREKNG